MKKTLTKFTTVALVGLCVLSGIVFSLTNLTYAEEEQTQEGQRLKKAVPVSAFRQSAEFSN